MSDASAPGERVTLGQVPLLRLAATGLILLVVLGVAWVGGAKAKPSSVAPTAKAHAVVLFGIPQLGVADLQGGNLPNLQRLIGQGAMAGMTAHTGRSRASSLDSYATISSGEPARGLAGSDDAYAAQAALQGTTAQAVAALGSGKVPHGAVVVVEAALAISHAGADLTSRPGALGDALHLAGDHTAVVGNADRIDANDLPVVSRPAAVATMDSRGATDYGSVGRVLLRAAPAAPFGLQEDPDQFMAQFEKALPKAQFVVLDPGDTDRSAAYAGNATKDQAEVLRQQALHATDALLGRVVAVLPKDDLLLVVGLTEPLGKTTLTPLVAYGAGVVPGHLESESTKVNDLVTLTDVAPTILSSLGVKVPTGMIGQPLRYRSGTVDQTALVRASDLAAGRERIYFPMSRTFIWLQGIIYLALILLFWQRFGRGGLSGLETKLSRLAVLAFAAWPLATFLLRLVPPVANSPDGAHASVWAASVVLALLADTRTRHRLDALARIAGLTVAVMVVDLGTGGHLQNATVLGYSPFSAARFTGIGNAAYSVLGAAAIVWAVVHIDRSAHRAVAIVDAAAVLALAAIVDGAPTLGSDVGGILSLVPVFGLLLWALSGRKISWRTLLLAGGATVALLGIATGIDLLRPPDARTHLGRLAANAFKSNGLATTLARKLATNIRVLTGTIWMWMVPIEVAYGIGLIRLARNRSAVELAPKGSAVRAGLWALLALGVLGSVVNDSGIVIAGTVAIFAGPYLTLLATDAHRATQSAPDATSDREAPPALTPQPA